ncbi:MAG: hypothetical protein HUT38_00530 [Candidatus Paceibacter sp.]|nr:hypothetical protein [Candidatus Paceibacter sp.]
MNNKKGFIKFFLIIIVVIISGYFLLAKTNFINNLTNFTEKDYYEYINKAAKDQNPGICYKIPIEKFKEECLSEVAPEITDPKKCEEFKDEDNKSSCYINVARFHKDITFCDRVTEERRDSCFSVVAVVTNDEKLCKDTTCILTIAKSKKDPNLCRKIPEMDLYDYSSGNPAYSVESCLMRYAVGLDDEKICLALKSQDDKNSCFRDVAINSGDINLCKNIKNVSGTPKVIECKIINGSKICEEKETFFSATDGFKIINCYSLIANNDPNECKKVRNDSVKLMNACYYEISRNNKDPNICQKIEIPNDNNVTCEDYLNYIDLVSTMQR